LCDHLGERCRNKAYRDGSTETRVKRACGPCCVSRYWLSGRRLRDSRASIRDDATASRRRSPRLAPCRKSRSPRRHAGEHRTSPWPSRLVRRGLKEQNSRLKPTFRLPFPLMSGPGLGDGAEYAIAGRRSMRSRTHRRPYSPTSMSSRSAARLPHFLRYAVIQVVNVPGHAVRAKCDGGAILFTTHNRQHARGLSQPWRGQLQ